MYRRILARRILAALQPLTGDRAETTVLATATGADVELRANTLAYPIVTTDTGSRQMDPSRPVRVAETTTVTSAGTPVPITSVLGGEAQNLGATTEVRWVPPVDGLAPTATFVEAATGATTATGPGSMRKITTYRQLGNAEAASALFFAQAGGPFPVGVLEWLGAEYGESRGPQTVAVRDRWRLAVVSARLDGHDQRSDENLDMLDAAAALLTSRSSVDGCAFSAPGIELIDAANLYVTKTSYVDVLSFATHSTLTRKEAREFPPWLWSTYELGAPKTIVAGIRDPMPQETP